MNKKYFSRINLKTLTTFASFILISIFGVLSATAVAIQSNDTIKAYKLLLKADSLTSSAKYDSANFYYELAAESYIKVAKSNSLLSMACTNRSIHCKNKKGWNLAIYQSQPDLAIEFLTIAMKNRGKKGGTVIARTYNNLGVAYTIAGNYNEALNAYFNSLSIYNQVFGQIHKSIADCNNNIGLAYFRKGELKKAVKYINSALLVTERLIGRNNKEYFSTINNLGVIYKAYGDYDKALDCFNSALTIYNNETSNLDKLSLAFIHNNIGTIYLARGDYFKAVQYFEKDLFITLTIIEENHHEVATIYNNIGVAYFDQKNYSKAVVYFSKAYKIRSNIYQKNHPEIAQCLNNLANVYLLDNNLKNAMKYYNKALMIRIATLDKGHPLIANTHANIATAYFKMDSMIMALKHQNISLNYLKKVYGSYHPMVGNDYIKLGDIFENDKNHKVALIKYQEAIRALMNPKYKLNTLYGEVIITEQINSQKYLLEALAKKAEILDKLYEVNN
ncbi:MAG: hypothetical protein COC01_04015 [Bacteroidetes bacterium]|nr:MAG: hypothetical protein COC01_04015 [Bacteroidota bacterium]